MASRDFSTALSWAKDGHSIRRRSWDNGWRLLAELRTDGSRLLVVSPENAKAVWTPDSEDLFAGDWDIIDQNVREA